MRGTTWSGALLGATLCVLSGTSAGAAPAPTVRARVVDQAGKPLAGVVVFAADASKVLGMAQSDEAGAVQLLSPRPRYNFGLMSPTFRLGGVTPRGPGRYDLIATPLRPAGAGDGANPEVAKITARGATVFHGRVVDETGRGLQGVRVEAARATGAVTATVLSTTGGSFALVVPGGEFGLRASAPGLVALHSTQQEGLVVLVMTVAAEVQTS